VPRDALHLEQNISWLAGTSLAVNSLTLPQCEQVAVM
jgi:hypothetical protein